MLASGELLSFLVEYPQQTSRYFEDWLQDLEVSIEDPLEEAVRQYQNTFDLEMGVSFQGDCFRRFSVYPNIGNLRILAVPEPRFARYLPGLSRMPDAVYRSSLQIAQGMVRGAEDLTESAFQIALRNGWIQSDNDARGIWDRSAELCAQNRPDPGDENSNFQICENIGRSALLAVHAHNSFFMPDDEMADQWIADIEECRSNHRFNVGDPHGAIACIVEEFFERGFNYSLNQRTNREILFPDASLLLRQPHPEGACTEFTFLAVATLRRLGFDVAMMLSINGSHIAPAIIMEESVSRRELLEGALLAEPSFEPEGNTITIIPFDLTVVRMIRQGEASRGVELSNEIRTGFALLEGVGYLTHTVEDIFRIFPDGSIERLNYYHYIDLGDEAERISPYRLWSFWLGMSAEN